MMDMKLVNTALGKEPADMVIKGGKLINVDSGEIYEMDIALRGTRIASIGPLSEGVYGPETKIVDAKGMYIAPGFIDAHIHIESSMLTYTEFSKLAVKRGTTAVATDLMEVTIVSGIEGMKEILKEAESLPIKLFYPVPSFMEDESALQTTGAVLSAEYIGELLKLDNAVGIAETLAPPILAGSPASARVIELAEQLGKTVEGHAPAVMGEALNAYASAGVTSDHESTHKQEALEKLRAGLRVLMREGSASTDLKDCLRIITEEGVDTRHCAMVSDDVDALHLSRLGHMDHKIRMAIAAGVDPVKAIQMATINPAEGLRIDRICGSVAPGKDADIVLLSDLITCKVETVISRGEIVVEGGRVAKEFPAPKYSDLLLDTVVYKNPITAEDMKLKVDASAKSAKVRVIGASSVSLLTQALEAELAVKDGVVLPDVEQDVLSIVCVERYGKNGNIGHGFIKGFELKEGAIAISVGHDHHNVSVVGSDAEDMACAVNRIAELQGGLVLVNKGQVLAEIALPVCGLLSTDDGELVADQLADMIEKLKKLGCNVPSPNVTLSFITLIFIPDYAITDRGLFDVKEFKIVDPILALNR